MRKTMVALVVAVLLGGFAFATGGASAREPAAIHDHRGVAVAVLAAGEQEVDAAARVRHPELDCHAAAAGDRLGVEHPVHVLIELRQLSTSRGLARWIVRSKAAVM
jgi:hypothetical protein